MCVCVCVRLIQYPVYSVYCTCTLLADIIAKSLYRRRVDSSTTTVTGVRSRVAELLPSNIAARPAPSTAELVEQHVSRKKMKATEI